MALPVLFPRFAFGAALSLDARSGLGQTEPARDRLDSDLEGLLRLNRRVSATEIERTLRATAREVYGAEHAAWLDERIPNVAEMLARIAAEPVAFAEDPPDHVGIDEEPDDG